MSSQRSWEVSALTRLAPKVHCVEQEMPGDEAGATKARQGRPELARAARALARMENRWEAKARDRARFIRRRLFTAPELERGEADFYRRYFLGRTWTPRQVPAVVKRSPDAWPHVEQAGRWSDFHLPPTYAEWEREFGQRVPHPVDPQGGVTGLLAVREEMIADGKLHVPGTRRTRGRPVTGEYTAALYLRRRTYAPLDPCRKHPTAEYSTKHHVCTECRAEKMQETEAKVHAKADTAWWAKWDTDYEWSAAYTAELERRAEEKPSKAAATRHQRALAMLNHSGAHREDRIRTLAEEARKDAFSRRWRTRPRVTGRG